MLLFFVANVNNMWTLPQSDFLHVTERPLSYVMNYNGCVLESQRGQGQCLFIYLFFLLLCSDYNQLVDGGCRKLENNSSLWRGRPLTTKTHRGRKSNLWYALHIVSYYSRTRVSLPLTVLIDFKDSWTLLFLFYLWLSISYSYVTLLWCSTKITSPAHSTGGCWLFFSTWHQQSSCKRNHYFDHIH